MEKMSTITFPDGSSYEITDAEARRLVSEQQQTIEQQQQTINEQNKNMGGLRFGKDGDGNYGYYGADGSLVPFKQTEIISCGTIGFNLASSRTLNISSILADNGYKTTDITTENVFLRPVGSISSRAKKNSSDTTITTGFTLSYDPNTGVVTAYCGDVSYQQSFGINFNVFVIPTT